MDKTKSVTVWVFLVLFAILAGAGCSTSRFPLIVQADGYVPPMKTAYLRTHYNMIRISDNRPQNKASALNVRPVKIPGIALLLCAGALAAGMEVLRRKSLG